MEINNCSYTNNEMFHYIKQKLDSIDNGAYDNSSLACDIESFIKNFSKLKTQIRIGDKFDYIEFNSETRFPCEIIDIYNNGYDVLYIFKHENSTSTGVTVFPQKFHFKI